MLIHLGSGFEAGVLGMATQISVFAMTWYESEEEGIQIVPFRQRTSYSRGVSGLCLTLEQRAYSLLELTPIRLTTMLARSPCLDSSCGRFRQSELLR